MGRKPGSKNKQKPEQESQVQTTAALAKIESKDIVDFLNVREKALESYAIRSYKRAEFMLSANIAISESPKLRNALKTGIGQRSLYHALRSAAATGLSLNPQQGKAALVPYKNQNGDLIVSYQIMKGGLIDLVMETGQVTGIVADLVREKDEFKINRTDLQDTYIFSPARRDRGSVDGYFAAITLKSGRIHISYMAIEEVQAHEKKYNSSKKLGERSPWAHSFDGMAIKSVIKKLLRNIHLSELTGAAISVDDHAEFSSDVIDIEGEPIAPPEETKPANDKTDRPSDETKPASDETDQKGTTADDVAAQLAASDSAADEQAGADSESTKTETPAI